MKHKMVLILFFSTFFLFSQNIDINILSEINLNRNTYYDGLFRSITNSAAPIAIGTPVVLYGIGLLTKDSVTLSKSYFIGATVITATVLSTALKYAVNRPRPFVTYPYIEKNTSGGSPSFPSGHTADAFSLATSLSIVYPKWCVIIPSYVWAGVVGYSRMDLGVHYPSDVFAGAILGTGSALLCLEANKWLNDCSAKRVNKKLKLSINNFNK